MSRVCWQRCQAAAKPLLQGEQPPIPGSLLQSPQHQHRPTCNISWGLLGTCKRFPPLLTPLGKQPSASGTGGTGPWDHPGMAQGIHLSSAQLHALPTGPTHTGSPSSTNPTPDIPMLLETFKVSPTVNLNLLTNHLHAPHLGLQRGPEETCTHKVSPWGCSSGTQLLGLLGSPGRDGVVTPDARDCDRQNRRSFCGSFALKLTYLKAVSGAFPWETKL